ncbi:MAG: bifunctional heptose 7-phosphate kinase/heptose 1-phosphate adenyltransferase, partial [Rhodanobacteraceae bacterium]
MSHADASIDRSFLTRIFGRMHELAVWVIGDVMLDEYAIGDTARISPEAPVPVVRVQRLEGRLGGAANVARQVATLGAHVSLAGLTGDDAAAGQILNLCRESGIDVRAVRQLGGRQTSRKLRGLARNQQLVRFDWEDTAPCSPETAGWMIDRLQRGRAADIIILSDYAKGVLTPALLDRVRAVAAATGARIVVDPKRRDFSTYRGADILTPNVHELEMATGKTLEPDDTASIAACAQSLARGIGVHALVVTRAEHGMLIVPAAGPEHSIPARGHVLFDPTGAGDTVVAVLATTLAAGATLIEAAN